MSKKSLRDGISLQGVIERRILLNYRVNAAIAARLLPTPFRPALVRGQAIVGACLIRLGRLRPRRWPAWLGLRLENAALRVAVEWDTDAGPKQGVFALSRYTASPLAAWGGGRLFPGVHARADFVNRESQREMMIAFRAADGTSLRIAGSAATDWPADSIFASAAEATKFFAAGSAGYSWNPRRGKFEGLSLCIPRWEATPFAVHELASNFFDDPQRFPTGSIAFDHAMLMRSVEHEWRVIAPIAAGPIADVRGDAVHSCGCGGLPPPPSHTLLTPRA